MQKSLEKCPTLLDHIPNSWTNQTVLLERAMAELQIL